MQKVLLNSDILQYSKVRCEHPQKVLSRTGRTVYVGCGSCPACLAKRRNGWSFRLEQESKSRRCIHSYGFTWTYDSNSVPYLPKIVLDSQDYTYIHPDKQHSYINVLRGCTPESIKSGENVPLLFFRDVQLAIKRLRKKVEKEFPNLFLRYYVSSEYGETWGTTNRPHYHGIIYVCQKDNIKLDTFLVSLIAKQVEDYTLDVWQYAKRFFDPRKRIYVGKDIHKFGQNWGNYLGKYLNKVECAKYDTGAKYIPPRCLCSRKSEKYGFGSLGSCFLYDNELRYIQFMNELRESKLKGLPFRPTYNENGFTKGLPSALVNNLLSDFFQVSLSKVAKYIYYNNLLMKYPKDWQLFFEKDPNDPFEILKKPVFRLEYPVFQNVLYYEDLPDRRCKMELLRRYIGMKPPKRKVRERYSIYCAPPPAENDPIAVCNLPKWSFTDRCRIERYLRFKDMQTALYLSQFDRIFSAENRIFSSCRINEDTTLTALPLYVHPRCQSFIVQAISERKAQINKCREIRQKALDYKYKHLKKNHYDQTD